MGEVILMSDLKRRKAERKAREHIGIKPEMLWEVLPNNSWKGQRCFIIGGGFSLNRFDYSLLKDDLTIGINRAFEKFNPTISFFSDTRFWGWLEQGHFGEGTKEKFKSQKIKVAFNYIDFPYPDGVLKVNEYQNDYISFDLNNGIMLGDNSGFAALNLAICLGANPIYLLGFDMKNINGRANWHEGYPEKAPGNIYDLYLKHFERNAGLIKERGFKVINLNPKSELKCFEFGNIEDVFKEEKKPLYMEGYAGIGDNFWQRPFIKEICKDNVLYLMTFTPQIYWDIPNLKFIRTPYPNFDSHNKIADRLSKTVWSKLPDNFTTLKKPSYWLGFKYGLTISDQFESLFKITDYDFSFPVKEEWIDRAREILSKLYIGNRKICIIRFPVNRKEWKCPAREPKPEYLQMLVDRYKDEYYFISLAEMSSNNEYFIEEPQNIDKAFHKGELSLGDIFGLVKLADMVIAGNCFLLPMALAIGTKTFAIFGGCQHPELFLDKRMDLSNFAYVLPEPFCNCLNPGHDCKKDISEGKIITAFENLKSKDTKSRFDYTGLVDLTGTYTKENLLIYKVGRIYHQGFKNNEYLNRKYNLIFEMNID